MKFQFVLAALMLSTLSPQISTAFAQGTAFTYQGRLNSGGSTANGSYDLRFAIFDSASAGAQQGSLLTNPATAVSNGLFTVTLDFGNQFPGADRWLEIAVSTNGANAFTTLTPRQQITSTPYAVRAASAATASSANSVAAANITGTIPMASLPPVVVTNNASGVNFSGNFSGNGAGITNVASSALAANIITANVVAWGYNGYGQTAVPAGLSNVVAVAANGYYSLALKKDGTVAAWGDNSLGQTNVPAGLNNVVAVAAGAYHSLALRNDGTVAAWGDNSQGQTTVPAGLNNVMAVAAGAYHSLALKRDGSVIAWGWNYYGQASVPAGLGNVVGVAAGGYHSLALKNDGTVAAWGDNSLGQTNVPAGMSNVVAVAAGGYHSLALKNDGTVVGWGYDSSGQTNVPAGLNNVVAVAAGGFYSLALKNDGTVVAWGDNSQGQTTVPAGLSNVVAVAAGSYHSLALQQQKAYTFSGNVQVNGVLSGDGSGLTNLNAGNISSGTLALAQLPADVATLDTPQTFTAPKSWGVGSILSTDGNGAIELGPPSAAFAWPFIDFHYGTGTTQDFNVRLMNDANGAISLYALSPATLMARFTPAGMGVNTANPQGSLHVYSTNNPTVVRIQSSGTPGFGRLEFVSNPQGDVNEWRPAYIQSTDAGGFTGGLAFCLNGSGSGSKFGSNEVMRIVNGAVGINTNNPQAPLHVRGNVLVDGADRVQLKATRTELSSNSVASGFLSVAMGGGTASGSQSVAVGASVASGAAASAFGNSLASGDASFAANYGQATNLYATAFGLGMAGGWGATALGAGNASGSLSVAMGDTTAASGYAATALGSYTVAAGTNSVAAGYNAQANHSGTFVWADQQGTSFTSTGTNQFLIRASGGVGIGTASPSKPLVVQKRLQSEPAIMVGGAMPGGPRIQTYGLDADAAAWMGLGCDMSGGPYEHSLYFPVGNNNGRFTIGSYDGTTYSTKLAVDINGNIRWGNGSLLSSDANGIIELGSPNSAAQQPIIDFHFGVGSVQDYNVRIINDLNETLTLFRASSGTPMARFNSGGLTVNGTFVSSSDRNVKENFKPISAGSVLEKVIALPISHWNYKEDKTQQHIGPMAQDFYAAFKVGPDDKHITTVDESGVALAAIQGLNQKLENENAAKDAEIAELKARLEKLERLLEQK